MELGLRIQKFEFGGGRGERAAKQIGEDPESRDFGKTKRDRRWQKTTRQAQNTVQAATVQAATVQAATVQAATVQAATVQAATVQAASCSRQSRRLPAWRLLLAD